jgi:hypothetical protein
MTIQKLCLTAALLASTALGSAAHANPISLGYSLGNSSNITVIATGNGSAGVSGFTVGNYTINLSATGTPVMSDPNFGSNTLSIRSRGEGTITLYATELNNNAVIPSFNIGLSNNPLSDYSVTESFYASSTNVAFAKTDLLASATLLPGGIQSTTAPFSLTTPYSITEAYRITFDGAGAVDATILEKANVPEPMSILVLGAGLAGLGMTRLRRKA